MGPFDGSSLRNSVQDFNSFQTEESKYYIYHKQHINTQEKFQSS